MTGTGLRLAIFAQAIGQIARSIHFVHFVPVYELGQYPPVEEIASILSSLCGVPASVVLAPRPAPRALTFWNYYVSGIFSIHNQRFFEGRANPHTIAAIREALADQPDLVFVHRLGAMGALLKGHLTHPRIVFDLDDIEHRVRVRQSLSPPFGPGKLISLMHVPPLLWAEWRAIRTARLTFICSDQDRTHLRRLGLGHGLAVVPNAIPVPDVLPPLVADPTLLFLGHYGYEPNVEAAKHLVQRLWPLIRRLQPRARLLIAGKSPENLCIEPAEGVEFCGFIADLPALYARARIICCPIQVGGGTRLKLIEGAAYGKPMVSTRIGAEGLLFRNGTEILIRDTDEEFAEACSQLLTNDDLARSLGANAYQMTKKHYDRCAVAGAVAARLRDVIDIS